MQDAYKNLEEYNLDGKHKVLLIFDELIADMIGNNKGNRKVTEIFVEEN